MHPQRHDVLQFGSILVPTRPFAERSLQLIIAETDQLPFAANTACGIVIAEPELRIGSIRSHIETHKDLVEDFNLSLAILVHSGNQMAVVERLLSELGLKSRSSVNLLDDVGYAAEFIARWNPGPPDGNPKISKTDVDVPPNLEPLLRKAFGDCDRIILKPLVGGRSSAGVFCVHAWLKQSFVGPRPMPFFIKVSDPVAIHQERFNYLQYADFYIPFHLRPNVVPERCVTTKNLASIVGNFVEDSISLKNALRSTQCPGIIFSLFENSLKGFRSQPNGGPGSHLDKSLADFLKDRSRSHSIKPIIIDEAQKLGLRTTPTDIEQRLCETVKAVKRPFGNYHGDLHSGNVMVRGNDAILIDFSAVSKGPLTADPVTLEVSLVFGTDENDQCDLFDDWKHIVDEIYVAIPIHQPPSLAVDPGPFSWLCRAVRELRHVILGCDCMQSEADAVLASYLLRFSRLSSDNFSNVNLSKLALSKQAYALVIAERIVDAMINKPVQDKTI